MNRRELLASAAAAGGIAWAGGAGAASAAGQTDDGAVMRSALSVELLVVFVYGRVLAGGTLGAAAAALARGILEHEAVHVRTVAAALTRLGVAAPPPPRSVAEADRRLSARNASGRLTGVHTELDALRLLYDVESISIGAYYEALPKLTEPALVQVTAEIMGAEAQHASAIGGLLHPGKWERVVPVASVQGKH
jgi:hypothetical protein